MRKILYPRLESRSKKNETRYFDKMLHTYRRWFDEKKTLEFGGRYLGILLFICEVQVVLTRNVSNNSI